MAQSIDHLPNTAPAAEIAARVEEHGAVIIDDLLDADVLTRFNAELDVDFAQRTAPPKMARRESSRAATSGKTGRGLLRKMNSSPQK